MSRRVVSRLMWIPVYIFNDENLFQNPLYPVMLSRAAAKHLT